MPTEKTKLILFGTLAATVLVLLGLAVAAGYEVVDKGQLLPYTEGKIYRVEVLGGLQLYVEPDIKPSLDVLNSALLLAIASMAGFGWVLVRAGGGRARVRLLLWLTALGTAWLAADELFGIHESIGHNLRFLADLPGIERPDDAIILLYAAPVAAYLIAFHRELLAFGRARAMFACGVLLFALAALADTASAGAEEAIEVLASMALFGGFGVFLKGQVLAALRPLPQPPVDAAAGHD